MKQIFGRFDLKTGEYFDFSSDIFESDNGALRLWIMGRAETDGKVNCPDAILSAFSADPAAFTQKVTGVYIALIYDTAAKKLYGYHDRSTSPYILYYTENNGSVYIGTSLKSLLTASEIKRKLNEFAVEDFIVNGYNYGAETLICDVLKLKAFHRIEVGTDGCVQAKTAYPLTEMTKGEAIDAFRPVVDRAVRKCFDGEPEINLPLSSGFDSNYIAYISEKDSDVPINAFSVGGKFGKNELPVVEKNAKIYKRMDLRSALTDDDTLQNLPDIVWRLEGSVYEVGLFLQYELAKLVSENGKKYLICGECADQVMNKYYLQKDRIEPEKADGKPMYYEFSEYPFIFGNYLILKKSGIMANSFGIETRYPYLDNEVVSVSHALRSINGKDKRVHTANCSECLPEEILQNMSKIGGATECHSLFNTPQEIKNFFAAVEISHFYRSHTDVIKRHSYSEKIRQTGFAGIKTKIRNAVMKLLHMGGSSNAYFNEEMKLREYICIAYLAAFEKLFVSDGAGRLDSDGTDKKLRDIL